MTTHKVHYTQVDSVALLTMDDGKANSIETTFLSEWHAALDRAEVEAKAVVIAGREGFFSAGLDLKVLPTLSPESLKEFIIAYGRAMFRLWLHPAPVVAAVTGHMIAGGAIIGLCCDRRIGKDGLYRVGMNEVAIGLPLPGFAWEIAAHSLLTNARTEALLFGKIYEPAQAVKIGYLDRLVSADQVVNEAMKEAHELGSLPAHALAQTKKLIRGPLVARAREQEAAILDGFFKEGPFAIRS
ncbi:MAG: crotonase/enoyl-CoA hydratase family protein [Acidobacteria bacterium]|nr:crotonase/enoyl-CoA hydratase family protein [Acidobacteriota bacterium]MBI3657670.1 crotonase/enoyl-CoA hydratase family protein [Acidobacteriota bacterium]